jgi:hypothetical protein
MRYTCEHDAKPEQGADDRRDRHEGGRAGAVVGRQIVAAHCTALDWRARMGILVVA